VNEELGFSLSEQQDAVEKQWMHVGWWGCDAGMVTTLLATRCPLEQKHEQVAGSEVDRLESKFGLGMCQIWTWANYKIFSSHDALQI
jgi:hypothetical protein